MNLGDTFSGIIHIDSHTRQRSEPVAPVPVPEAGLRIGRPSAFSFSTAGASRSDDDGGGDGSSGLRVVVNLPKDEPPEFMRLIRAKAQIGMQEVRVPDPNDATRYVDVDRISVLRFAFIEYPPKLTRGSLQPAVSTEYSLRFDLHPETENKLREFEVGGDG